MYPGIRTALTHWIDSVSSRMNVRKQKSKYTRKKGKRKP